MECVRFSFLSPSTHTQYAKYMPKSFPTVKKSHQQSFPFYIYRLQQFSTLSKYSECECCVLFITFAIKIKQAQILYEKYGRKLSNNRNNYF